MHGAASIFPKPYKPTLQHAWCTVRNERKGASYRIQRSKKNAVGLHVFFARRDEPLGCDVLDILFAEGVGGGCFGTQSSPLLSATTVI